MKFRNKYRIDSARAKFWDYGWNGLYFVTIYTREKQYFFGDVTNGEMELSAIGKLAQEHWFEIQQKFSFVKLDAFVVMPNHVHGILEINKVKCGGEDAINRVSTRGGGVTGIHNPMGKNNISEIIRWYKGRITFEARKIHPDFGWQAGFHDHIIEKEISYQLIKEYIKANPQKWQKDQFFRPI